MSADSAGAGDRVGDSHQQWRDYLRERPGQMPGRILDHDWAADGLGQTHTWPVSLRTAVALCVQTGMASVIWWGPQLRLIYNDAYQALLPSHLQQSALGQPGPSVWPHLWPTLAEIFPPILAGGAPGWWEDAAFPLERAGFVQDSFVTSAVTALLDDEGRPAGIYALIHELTPQVLSRRRLRTLDALAAGLQGVTSEPLALRVTASILAANRDDVSGVSILQVTEEQVRLEVSVGQVRELQAHEVLAAVQAGSARVLEPAAADPPAPASGTELDPAPVRAAATLLAPCTGGSGAGATVLACALNPRLLVDDAYRAYLEVAASYLSAALAEVRRYEAEQERARAHEREARWRTGMIAAMSEAVFVCNADGDVVEINAAFTALTGWGPEGLPYTRPYPWWWETADAERDAVSRQRLAQALSGSLEQLVPIRHRSGRQVWTAARGVGLPGPGEGEVMMLGTARDVTREVHRSERQEAAALLAAALGAELDLEELAAAAVYGFGTVFEGQALLYSEPVPQTGDGPPSPWTPSAASALITADGPGHWSELPEAVRAAALAARTSTPGSGEASAGILIRASTPARRQGVWVHFPAERVVSDDERILAMMLGSFLATTLDRAHREARHAQTEANLRQALDGHRVIGQAVGVLIERHGLTHQAAFERLRRDSNRRNIKLRELAQSLVDRAQEL
ncbi:MAG: ANTAR domain-containing protein [Sporichthyaceae bacterium]